MKQNKKRETHNNKIQKKVIRCKALNRPVFEHESCSKFSLKTDFNNQKKCVNCVHSF